MVSTVRRRPSRLSSIGCRFERGDPGLGEGGDPLRDVGLRADQRRGPHEVLGHGGRGLVLAPGEVEVLDRLRLGLVPVAAARSL